MSWLNPQYAWAFGLVAAVVLLFLWAAWRHREALRRFGEVPLVSALTRGLSTRRRRWKAAFVVLAAAMVALSLMGPRFGTRLRKVEREGIDLVIALDVSLSMQAEDVAPNRLDRAKNEIKKMLGTLRGDRVGLIIFAGDAFIQCPLTTDYNAVRLFLDVADPSLIPTPGTDFTAALQMAMQAFDVPDASGTPPGQRKGTKALLIVSDGENHAQNIGEFIERARDQGIVTFAAGVGETDGVPIPLYRNGVRIGYKKDQDGQVVRTRLEEASLQSLASDGAYFRIARTSSSLPQITAALERLEKSKLASEEFEEYEEKYQWPLALALLLLFGERLLSDRRRKMRKPEPA